MNECKTCQGTRRETNYETKTETGKGDREMKIEIWNEEQKEEEQLLRLRLMPDMSKGVVLNVVDANGRLIEAGHLLAISASGRLSLCPSVNSSLGLKLDDSRRLKVTQ